MPPCLKAKKASSNTDLMFQFYLPKVVYTIFLGQVAFSFCQSVQEYLWFEVFDHCVLQTIWITGWRNELLLFCEINCDNYPTSNTNKLGSTMTNAEVMTKAKAKTNMI